QVCLSCSHWLQDDRHNNRAYVTQVWSHRREAEKPPLLHSDRSHTQRTSQGLDGAGSDSDAGSCCSSPSDQGRRCDDGSDICVVVVVIKASNERTRAQEVQAASAQTAAGSKPSPTPSPVHGEKATWTLSLWVDEVAGSLMAPFVRAKPS
ncbi:hypothetical protein INR49_006839, partial [Caranx melampygus]